MLPDSVLLPSKLNIKGVSQVFLFFIIPYLHYKNSDNDHTKQQMISFLDVLRFFPLQKPAENNGFREVISFVSPEGVGWVVF